MTSCAPRAVPPNGLVEDAAQLPLVPVRDLQRRGPHPLRRRGHGRQQLVTAPLPCLALEALKKLFGVRVTDAVPGAVLGNGLADGPSELVLVLGRSGSLVRSLEMRALERPLGKGVKSSASSGRENGLHKRYSKALLKKAALLPPRGRLRGRIGRRAHAVRIFGTVPLCTTRTEAPERFPAREQCPYACKYWTPCGAPCPHRPCEYSPAQHAVPFDVR